MKVKVYVEKRLYCAGDVEIEAEDEDEAILRIQHRIDTGNLRLNDVRWDPPQYEDFSFSTTGYADGGDA